MGVFPVPEASSSSMLSLRVLCFFLVIIVAFARQSLSVDHRSELRAALLAANPTLRSPLPGLRINLLSKAIPQLAKIWEPRVTAMIRAAEPIHIPDPDPVEKDGVKITPTNMIITQTTHTSFAAAVVPNVGIRVSLGGLAAKLSADIAVHTILGTSNLKADVGINETLIALTLSIGLNATNSKPSITVSTVDFTLGKLDIKISGSIAGWILDKLVWLFSGLIRSTLQKTVQSQLASTVNAKAAATISALPLPLPLPQVKYAMSFDYSLTSAPVWSANNIIFELAALVAPNTTTEHACTVDSPVVMPSSLTTQTTQMFVSQAVVNCMFQAAIDSGFLYSTVNGMVNNGTLPKGWEMEVNITTAHVTFGVQDAPQGNGATTLLSMLLTLKNNSAPLVTVGIDLNSNLTFSFNTTNIWGELVGVNGSLSVPFVSDAMPRASRIRAANLTAINAILPAFNNFIKVQANHFLTRGVKFPTDLLGYLELSNIQMFFRPGFGFWGFDFDVSDTSVPPSPFNGGGSVAPVIPPVVPGHPNQPSRIRLALNNDYLDLACIMISNTVVDSLLVKLEPLKLNLTKSLITPTLNATLFNVTIFFTYVDAMTCGVSNTTGLTTTISNLKFAASLSVDYAAAGLPSADVNHGLVVLNLTNFDLTAEVDFGATDAGGLILSIPSLGMSLDDVDLNMRLGMGSGFDDLTQLTIDLLSPLLIAELNSGITTAMLPKMNQMISNITSKMSMSMFLEPSHQLEMDYNISQAPTVQGNSLVLASVAQIVAPAISKSCPLTPSTFSPVTTSTGIELVIDQTFLTCGTTSGFQSGMINSILENVLQKNLPMYHITVQVTLGDQPLVSITQRGFFFILNLTATLYSGNQKTAEAEWAAFTLTLTGLVQAEFVTSATAPMNVTGYISAGVYGLDVLYIAPRIPPALRDKFEKSNKTALCEFINKTIGEKLAPLNANLSGTGMPVPVYVAALNPAIVWNSGYLSLSVNMPTSVASMSHTEKLDWASHFVDYHISLVVDSMNAGSRATDGVVSALLEQLNGNVEVEAGSEAGNVNFGDVGESQPEPEPVENTASSGIPLTIVIAACAAAVVCAVLGTMFYVSRRRAPIDVLSVPLAEPRKGSIV